MRVLVTGGTRGIGSNIVDYLSKFHEVHTFSRKDGDICTYAFSKLDLASYDVLVNNAGVGHSGYLGKQDYSKIEELINVNVLGVIRLTQAFVKARLKLGGNIVNIGSIVSKRGYPGLSVYSASKAAINGFTQSLAAELGPKNFRVNAILPGYIETEMTKDVNFETIKTNTPCRLTTRQDIARTVAFLLQDNNINGQLITVDGGYSL